VTGWEIDTKSGMRADAYGVAAPANWNPGDDVIVSTASSCGAAKEPMESKVVPTI